MDTELLLTITTKGTYYYPASNKALINKKEYDSIQCMVCEINEQSIDYFNFYHNEHKRNIIICENCWHLYHVYVMCDNCKKKDLIACINYENYDICLKCAHEFTENYKKPLTTYAFINEAEQKHIIIEAACYLTTPCQHKVDINGITTIMSAPDIIRLLQINNFDIPEHFNTEDNKQYLECKDSYHADRWG